MLGAMGRKTTLIALYGAEKDSELIDGEHNPFRPTLELCNHAKKPPIDRLVLLAQKDKQGHWDGARRLKEQIEGELNKQVTLWPIQFEKNPWGYDSVYSALRSFSSSYRFKRGIDYLFSIKTGTDTFRTCATMLAINRRLPVDLIQISEGQQGNPPRIFVLRLDKIHELVKEEQAFEDAESILTAGVKLKSVASKKLFKEIEELASQSAEPILLLGDTGTGKTELARRIHKWRMEARESPTADDKPVEVNCAGLTGELLQSELFGHVKGAFTGAARNRNGKLLEADQGTLFLDEVAELPIATQVLLLKALEEKEFCPLGSEESKNSDFQLICATNRDLPAMVRSGQFRADLFARIGVWLFRLPSFVESREDIPEHLDNLLKNRYDKLDRPVILTKEAKDGFIEFSQSDAAKWLGNFRDLIDALKRMAARAKWDIIQKKHVEEEIANLEQRWKLLKPSEEALQEEQVLARVLGRMQADRYDRLEKVQMLEVIRVCTQSKSVAEAGRVLFDKSRTQKSTRNDSDRLRKMLKKWGLSFRNIQKTAKS